MLNKIPQGPTKFVVGGLIGAALAVAMFALVGWKWGLFCTALLVYEAWTFFNKYENDTISEILWFFVKRPLVPLLFGLAAGWGIESGFIPVTKDGVWTTFAIGFLYGHFFFQRQVNGNVG